MSHSQYLKTCIELARRGASGTHPNPMVGAVIINEGEIVGEGWHQRYGESHAEANAVRDATTRLKSQGLNPQEVFKNSTIYISLEPCVHHGKTPPCSDLIIEQGFKCLVYASHDPNPLVRGKGLAKLLSHRIEVIAPENIDPELVTAAEHLNRAFHKTIRGETWVTAKIAITEDGSMIAPPRSISNSVAQRDVHLIRASHQALLTGYGTVTKDDPQLNIRYTAEELGLSQITDPLRIVLTRERRFTEEEKSRLKIFQGTKPARLINSKQYPSLKAIISELRQEGLTKLMLEAGPTLTQSFIEAGLVDELVVYQPTTTSELKAQAKHLANNLDGLFRATGTHNDEHNTTRNNERSAAHNDKHNPVSNFSYELIPGKEGEKDNLRLCLKLARSKTAVNSLS